MIKDDLWAGFTGQDHDGEDEGDAAVDLEGVRTDEQAGAVPEGGAQFYDTAQEAAGHSELQIAFERAYERMLRQPPPSIVDTVLSEAWQPNAKKSAQWRRSFQAAVRKKTEWEVRNPAEERRPYYDSLSDGNCRRVVENPKFRKMIMRTRPDSEFIFAQRVISEERNKPDPKKERRLRAQTRKNRAELWAECVRRFMQAPQEPEGGAGGDVGAGMPERDGTAAAEEGVKEAWGVVQGGVNADFNSLNAVLMNEAHRPAAFASLKQQLEGHWMLLRAPAADTKHVRRYTFLDPSPTNLAHLFYQASRWSQYRVQVPQTPNSKSRTPNPKPQTERV